MNSTSGLCLLRDTERNYEKQRKIKIDISKTEYPLIRNIATNQIGWTIWGRKDQKGHANLFWVDTYITEETIKRLNPYQRINHFPNSQELGKKNNLVENLNKMSQLMPETYNFFPKTWIMPEQMDKLKADYDEQTKYYIVKPFSCSQGKGIFLTNQIGSLSKQHSIVQRYIPNPCLIDQCKFDLRIYVFIKSLYPLKIFKYTQGLTRLSIHKYEQPNKTNKNNMTIHLTNYAINKLHPDYVQNKDIEEDSVGHKRSLSSIYEHLKKNGCDQVRLQSEIDQIIVKTVLAAYPKMLDSYKNCRETDLESQSVCFQILGFDILVDQQFRPWLLQVNHSPSFNTDSPLDHIIKKCLVLDTFLLLNLKKGDKQTFLKNRMKQTSSNKQKDLTRVKRQEQNNYENTHLGGYQKIYPSTKAVYIQILKKITEKNCKKRKVKNVSQLKKVQKTEYSEKKQISQIFRKTSNIISIYSTINSRLRAEGESTLSYFKSRQEDALRRHLLFQKQKQKQRKISPIKMNNVNISFKEQGKRIYLNGFSSHRNNLKNKGQFPQFNQTCRASFGESKTSQGLRKQVKSMQGQIRSKIGQMKFARIKLQRIKNVEKKVSRDLSSPRRIIDTLNHSKNNDNFFTNIQEYHYNKYV